MIAFRNASRTLQNIDFDKKLKLTVLMWMHLMNKR